MKNYPSSASKAWRCELFAAEAGNRANRDNKDNRDNRDNKDNRDFGQVNGLDPWAH